MRCAVCALRLRSGRARSRDLAPTRWPSAAPRPPAGRPPRCNDLWHQHGCQLGRRGARRAACGRMCSCSWLCAVGHRSAVLRRAMLCCCGACLLRVMGCSCSRHGLLSHDCARDADCLQGCRELAQICISQNLIENLPARAARGNFREICLYRVRRIKICEKSA